MCPTRAAQTMPAGVIYLSPRKFRWTSDLQDFLLCGRILLGADTLLCIGMVNSGRAGAGGLEWLFHLQRAWFALACLSST